jgi:Ca2+-binding EF-hand superfamily protein
VEPAESTPKEAVPGRLLDEVLKKFDKNGNGKLDDDEKERFLAERAKRAPAPNAEASREANFGAKRDRAKIAEGSKQRVLQRFDKDGDGKLNAEERAAAEKARGELGKELGKELTARSGKAAKKNGQPNRQELRKPRQRRRWQAQRRRTPGPAALQDRAAEGKISDPRSTLSRLPAPTWTHFAPSALPALRAD